jgi:hypothetical protein
MPLAMGTIELNHASKAPLLPLQDGSFYLKPGRNCYGQTLNTGKPPQPKAKPQQGAAAAS